MLEDQTDDLRDAVDMDRNSASETEEKDTGFYEELDSDVPADSAAFDQSRDDLADI